MREVDPVAVKLDHALPFGELDVVEDTSRQRLEQGHRGSRKGGDSNERLADTRWQRPQSLRHEGAQALGQRDIRAVHADGVPGDRAPELECEERVSTSDLVHAHQLRSRQAERKPTPKEPMARPDAKGLDREPLEPPERLVEFERHLNGPATHGCENTHRLALRRRSMNLRTSAELASTHCTSSRATRSGPS